MVWCMVGLAMVLQVIHGLVYGGVGYGPPNSGLVMVGLAMVLR